ncbi:copper resistance protein CopC [Candidatus Methylomirabilis sp.]|uniref:copper resistance CopC/CopD family protein n=1 Tax=Candidatus Methylomirabilis sp. TaxID=2032687 RepID=UPI002A6535B2|nr:copper resistance protein CopC [Candidatus Methylomirabilis sp.]
MKLIPAPFVTLSLLLLTTTAWGHAFPDHSEPRVGGTLQPPPPRVRLWFDGALEPAFSTIKVVNAGHQQVDNGDGRVNPADHTVLEASLPPLPQGQYRIVWSVVAHDGHRTEGGLSFAIGPGLPDRPWATSAAATIPQLFVRWLSFIGLSMLIGALAFRLLLIRSVVLPRQAFETVERPLRRLELSLIVLVALTTIGELILRTQMMSDVRLIEIHVTLPVVLLQTHFGVVWLIRLGFIGIMGLVWGFGRTTVSQSQRTIMLSLSAATLIALTTSLSGHAGDWGDLTMPVLIDWIHLVAVSIWIGGLFTFGFLLQRVAVPPRTEEVTRKLAAIGRPFSRMAAYCVFTLLVAGLFNAWLQVRSLQPFVTTSYGLTLFVKVVLVGLVLTLAAVNRYYFLPLLRDPLGARYRPLVTTIGRLGGAWLVGAGGDQVAGIRRRLRQFMRLEWILVIAALALAALLTHLPPARHILAHHHLEQQTHRQP